MVYLLSVLANIFDLTNLYKSEKDIICSSAWKSMYHLKGFLNFIELTRKNAYKYFKSVEQQQKASKCTTTEFLR